MIFLRQSTASQEIPLGPFVDSVDGNSQETGLTIANTDIKLQKAGATTQTNKNSGGATHIATGDYYTVLDATDTDTVGALRVKVHVSGALAVWVDCHVLEEAVYDAFFAASATGYINNAPVNVAQFGGTNGTFAAGRPEVNLTHIAGTIVSSTTAQLGVNVVQISGDATSADNLESYTDGTTPMPVNITQISGDATAADNLESYCDGTTPQPVNTTQIEGVDATNQIRDSIVDDATRIDASALNTLSSHDPGETIMGATDLGTGAGLTAIPWNAAWDAEVQSECTDALNAYDPPTNAEMVARTLAAADYATAANLSTVDGIVDSIVADTVDIQSRLPATLNGDGLMQVDVIQYAGTPQSNGDLPIKLDTIIAVTNKLDDTLEDDSGTYRFTANALELAPTGEGGTGTGGITAQEVWEYATRTLTAATLTSGALATAANVSAVETDTQDIQSRLPTALVSGRIDAIVGAMANNVITAAASATDFNVEVGAAVWGSATRRLTDGTNIVLAKGTGVTGFTDLSAAQVNAEVDTALADYDAPTNAEMIARTLVSADYATAANLTTVDTVVDAVKVKTDSLTFSTANRVDCQVYGMQADTVTSSALATSAVTEIQSGLSTLTEAGIRTAIGMASADLDTQLDAIPTAVWTSGTRTLTAFGFSVVVSDKTGFSLTSAYDAAMTASQAGDEMDLVDAPNATAIAAIQDGLYAGTPPTTAEIADRFLGRSIQGGADGGRTVTDALRPGRNRVQFDVPSAGQFTVFQENDSDVAWTGTYSRPSGLLTQVNPSGGS